MRWGSYCTTSMLGNKALGLEAGFILGDPCFFSDLVSAADFFISEDPIQLFFVAEVDLSKIELS